MNLSVSRTCCEFRVSKKKRKKNQKPKTQTRSDKFIFLSRLQSICITIRSQKVLFIQWPTININIQLDNWQQRKMKHIVRIDYYKWIALDYQFFRFINSNQNDSELWARRRHFVKIENNPSVPLNIANLGKVATDFFFFF